MAWLNYLLALQLRISIEIDPTAKLKILVRNLEKILKIKTQKLVFIVQKPPKLVEKLHFGTILLNLAFITVTRFGDSSINELDR